MTTLTLERAQLRPTRTDLPAESRRVCIELLNTRLADAVDLMLQAKQAHWNVRGPSFFSLHQLFDRVHGKLTEHVDLLAERAVQLGGTAEGTVEAAAARSSLPPYGLDLPRQDAHLEALSASLSTFSARLRDSIAMAAETGDATTADVLTQISRGADESLWMVEAHQSAA